MKRPQGFEPATRRQATPPPAKSEPKPQRVPKPATVRVAKPPATSAAPRTKAAVSRPDRDARIELRRAARERRRYERAEVKRFTRRARNRRIGWITAGGVVLALAAMLLIAIYSPILALQTITVSGTSRVDDAAVKAAVGDQIGTPLPLVNVDQIKKELSAFPLIRSYTTETVPPNTLLIHVTEREPVAAIANGSSWDLVDPAGVVIQTVAKQPSDVPVISAGAPGGAAFVAAAEVLLQLPASLHKRVSEIDATTEDDVSFLLSDTGQKVIWGSSERSDQKALALTALIKSQKKNTKVDFNVSSPDIALVIQQKSTATP